MPVYSLSAQEPEPTVIDRVIEIDKAIEEDPFEGRKRRDLNMIKTRELSARNAGLVQNKKLPVELLSATKGIDFRDIAKEIVVANEGYKEKPYKGADQVWTGGIGATGKGAKELNTPEAIYTRFDKDLEKHIGRAKEAFGSSFEKFHPITQAFVVDSYFRGGLAGSRNTRNLMKEGKFKKAAEEFLDHREYLASRDGESYQSKRKDKDGKTYYVEIWPGPGVARRMERFSDHLKSLPSNTKQTTSKPFDPEGSGYDMKAATAAGMERDKTGHMGSVIPVTEAERKKHGLLKGSYRLLKGKKHETWDLAVKAEEARGYKVIKRGSHYYSQIEF